VIVAGAAHHVDDDDELAAVAGVDLKPWVESEPGHMIRVYPVHVEGQRVRAA
jgi:hypothetical protein